MKSSNSWLNFVSNRLLKVQRCYREGYFIAKVFRQARWNPWRSHTSVAMHVVAPVLNVVGLRWVEVFSV